MYRHDAPENCRLFILSGKGIKEDVFREKFEQFGKIEDLWIVKDKRTNDDKGVVYITYSKTSEAALAMEEMNGKVLPGNPKPIKVLIANTKRDGSIRDPREDERLVRLFVIIPKTYEEDDLMKEFSEFGDVASVSVLRDKDSGNNKGFGYVKFHRAYHAALALENCNRSFKPKFAEPKKPIAETVDKYARDSYSDRYDDRRRSGEPGGYPYSDRERGLKRGYDDYGDRESRRDRRDDFIADDGRSRYSAGSGSGSGSRSERSSHYDMGDRGSSSRGGGASPFDMLQDYSHTSCQRLHVTAPLGLTQNYLSKLFNLIPGLEYCDLNEQTGLAYVRYQTPQCAAYARDKLDQFEYPIGSRLIVRFSESIQPSPSDMRGHGGGGYGSGGRDMDHPQSESPVHQAARVLEQAGINPDIVLNQPIDSKTERVTYCSINLPLPRPLMPEDSPVAQRLFIVCQPAAVPDRILRDAFSRFGSLIDVYLLSGRNFGYAKYASKESSMNAMRLLHGQYVAGQRLKVLEAEPQKYDDDGHKRQRTEDNK